MKNEYFTKVPNKYIRCDIVKNLGISNKFFIIYILIDRYRSYEDYSWLTVKEVFEFYNYKNPGRKSKAFKEVIDILIYMSKTNMIKIYQSLDEISYDTGIKIKIIPENFDCKENFTKFTTSQFTSILAATDSINKENLLRVFLYVSSYIGAQKNGDGYDYPAAFYKSVTHMSDEIGMSKKTITQCLDCLIQNNGYFNPLLVKREVQDLKRVPHIYTFNNEDCETNIKQAIEKIKILKMEE